jgi:hypothetical protein
VAAVRRLVTHPDPADPPRIVVARDPGRGERFARELRPHGLDAALAEPEAACAAADIIVTATPSTRDMRSAANTALSREPSNGLEPLTPSLPSASTRSTE